MCIIGATGHKPRYSNTAPLLIVRQRFHILAARSVWLARNPRRGGAKGCYMTAALTCPPPRLPRLTNLTKHPGTSACPPWRPPVRRRGTHVTAHPSPHGARSRPGFPPPPAAQRTPLSLAPFSHKRRRGRASAAGRRAPCARAWRGGAHRGAPAPVHGPMACVGSDAPPHPPPR